jgi:aminoglycoside 6'-N-acetyltransferase
LLFENSALKVRYIEMDDREVLSKWLSNPSVLEYYEGRDNPFNLDKVQHVFFNRENGTKRCMVEYEGVKIGYIQYYKLDEESKVKYGYKVEDNIYGMDQFIGETSYWNKGIGQLLVSSMVTFLVEQEKAKVVVMDPQTWNVRAINCYEKCGFKKVKLLPKNELHEGQYRDCWLIEYKLGVL